MAWRLRRCANIRRGSEAKHCSSLCSQSEGERILWRPNTAKNPTKSCRRALAIFATCSWPSLCEQSELQCWRRNRRSYGPMQISASRALLLTFDISILNTLPVRGAYRWRGLPRNKIRDMSPLQVGCSKSRNNPMLKLRDFGLVKLLAFNA